MSTRLTEQKHPFSDLVTTLAAERSSGSSVLFIPWALACKPDMHVHVAILQRVFDAPFTRIEDTEETQGNIFREFWR
jgi:hypothetical protein